MFALDANTVVYFFKGHGRVADRLLAVPPREVAMPAVVLCELEAMVLRAGAPSRRRQLEELVASISVLPFGPAESRFAARIRRDLERAGTPIGPLDNLIAGTALAHGAALVTHNTREFSRVSGLTVVDWY